MADPEITIQIHLGNVSFSFKTKESGDEIDNGIRSIQRIIKTHVKTLTSIGSKHKTETSLDSLSSPSELSLASLNIKQELRDKIIANIRQVSYWSLILTLLYHAPRALTYDDMISLSKEMGKPVAYDWLNTEFQRTKYRGLVRSEEIAGSKKKKYSITEVGRKKAKSFFDSQIESKGE